METIDPEGSFADITALRVLNNLQSLICPVALKPELIMYRKCCFLCYTMLDAEVERELLPGPDCCLRCSDRLRAEIETRSISAEVEAIYASFIIVEDRCIEFDDNQVQAARGTLEPEIAFHGKRVSAMVHWESVVEELSAYDKQTEAASISYSMKNSESAMRTKLRNYLTRKTNDPPSDTRSTASLSRTYSKKHLPVIVNGVTISGRHDTGAEGNFVSQDQATELGLPVRPQDGGCNTFSMGNGKLVRSIGRVRTWVMFANEPETRTKCWFNVLPKLTSGLILGSKFLKVTQTLSKYKSRLQACVPILGALPSVNLIGSTTQAKTRFSCHVDGRPTLVSADSASDLDLMSSTYIKSQRYRLDRRAEVRKRVRLADDTVAQTIGQVNATVMLADGSRYRRTFDVLPGLTSDVLFGDEFLEEIDAFALHEDSFVEVSVGERYFELNVLTNLGPVNDYIRGKISSWMTKSSVLSGTASTEAKRIDGQDWQELLRHDRETARINRELTGRAQELAQAAEDQRFANYEQERNMARAALMSSPTRNDPPPLPVRNPIRLPATVYTPRTRGRQC